MPVTTFKGHYTHKSAPCPVSVREESFASRCEWVQRLTARHYTEILYWGYPSGPSPRRLGNPLKLGGGKITVVRGEGHQEAWPTDRLSSAHMNSQSLHSSLRHSTAPLVKFSSCLLAFCHTRSHLWKHSFPSVSLAWDDHSVDTRTCLMLQIPSLHRISEHCTYMGFAFYFGLDLQSHFKCF